MIITRTPFRISFIGGGSDIPSYYKRFPGCVLSSTINKFMYIASHRFFDKNKVRLKYSKTETIQDINNIKHPIFREVLKKFNFEGGIEFSSIADVPSGTGMGSSSSFTVGLLHNAYVNRKKYVSKETLARDACEIEIDILNEPIGKQDQYAASYGGINAIQFNTDDSVNVEKIYLKKSILTELERNLVLFYTGEKRAAHTILEEQKRNLLQDKYAGYMKHMVSLVNEAKSFLINNKLDDFARTLSENWEIKKKLSSNVSNEMIDRIYRVAMKNGAIGGKLLGAGESGFFLFYCPYKKQQILEDKIGLKKFDFKFESEGSKVIHYSDED
ncbi:hypothetical protein [Ekhidna sp.]|jgi:D-glycero-alpha-D-manno-heptose-7-phosphate kinase|uniref:GHMP family kinase ATP-binding protein n=1 Tax=Ekhidna sp. TaxID=2608089 RepID=UPI0032F020DA